MAPAVDGELRNANADKLANSGCHLVPLAVVGGEANRTEQEEEADKVSREEQIRVMEWTMQHARDLQRATGGSR